MLSKYAPKKMKLSELKVISSVIDSWPATNMKTQHLNNFRTLFEYTI